MKNNTIVRQIEDSNLDGEIKLRALCEILDLKERGAFTKSAALAGAFIWADTDSGHTFWWIIEKAIHPKTTL